jgi:hypothetical protein
MAFDNIRVDTVNTRPTSPTAVSLAQINEDINIGGNFGTVVSAIVTASGSTDADSNPLGIAITAADNANGQWQYSTNGGAAWQNLSAVSTNAARLLDPANRIRFVPNLDFNSLVGPSPAVSFKVWDKTIGAVGGTGDTTTGTAFSALSAQSTQPIAAINDAPTYNLIATNVQTDGEAYAATAGGFATGMLPGPPTAIDETSQNLEFLLTVIGSTGGLYFDVEPSIDATTGTLSFTAATNTHGTATVQVILRDDGNGVLPNLNSSSPQTFTIEIGPTSGDYNRNQLADAADYVTWRKTEGSIVDSHTGADGSGDGYVGPEDYDIWRMTFGNVVAVASESGIDVANDTFQADTSVQSAMAPSANVLNAAVVKQQRQTAALNVPTIDALRVQKPSWRLDSGRPEGDEASSGRNQVPEISHRLEAELMAWLTRAAFVGDAAGSPMADIAHDDNADAHDLQIQSIDYALETLADYLLATRQSQLEVVR